MATPSLEHWLQAKPTRIWGPNDGASLHAATSMIIIRMVRNCPQWFAWGANHCLRETLPLDGRPTDDRNLTNYRRKVLN